MTDHAGGNRLYRCWAEIDLAALERNVRRIRANLPSSMRYIAVVKADAYGHGLHHVAARLMHAGADMFAVANVAEAAALRELGPGWPILVLSPVLPREEHFLVDHDLAVTVSSHEEITRFETLARRANKTLSVHLKIDTGMGRLGVWHEDASNLYEHFRQATHLRLAGICTHFASSDDDAGFTEEQRHRFVAALKSFRGWQERGILVHADNSAALATTPTEGIFNAARVGLLQFCPLPPSESSLVHTVVEPVFSFRTRVGLVKRLPRGASISYGRTRVVTRDTTIAILCAGYADGIPRSSSNRAHVLIQGQRCPVLGRITMDQTIVDVTDLDEVNCDDEAVFFGRQGEAEISVAEFSNWAGTISWETLCSVSKRVPRVYRTALGL